MIWTHIMRNTKVYFLQWMNWLTYQWKMFKISMIRLLGQCQTAWRSWYLKNTVIQTSWIITDKLCWTTRSNSTNLWVWNIYLWARWRGWMMLIKKALLQLDKLSSVETFRPSRVSWSWEPIYMPNVFLIDQLHAKWWHHFIISSNESGCKNLIKRTTKSCKF